MSAYGSAMGQLTMRAWGSTVGGAALMFAAGPAVSALPAPQVVEVTSEAMEGPRRLSIFRGDACREALDGCRVIYMADGEMLHRFLREAPAGATADRLVVVGLHNDHTDRTGRARQGELLRDDDRARYRAFEQFVTREVVTYVEGATPRPADDRFTLGFSNGGAWAIDMLERRREVFCGTVAMSVADQSTRGRKITGARVFLGSGRHEAAYYIYTRRSADALKGAGAKVEERYVPGDHNPATWTALFWWAVGEMMQP